MHTTKYKYIYFLNNNNVPHKFIPREPNPNFLVNLTWRAVKGCVTKI